MNTAEENSVAYDNLVYLREETLTVVASVVGVIGYGWLLLNIWPVTGGNAPLSSWLGALSLVVSASLSYYLRTRNLHIASHLLVWSILFAIICGILISRLSDTVYMLALPIIFASVLLSPRTLFFASVLINLFIIILRLGSPVYTDSLATPTFAAVIIPVFIINMVTLASWLGSRNLHTSLVWFSSSFDKAYENERIAREQGAELRRVLKALDDLMFRLERSNYTLMLERNQAEEAKRVKQQFVQTISHELRTPLNMVVAFTELMVQSPEFYGSPLPVPYVRDLSIVYRNATHLQSLVNDVLDMARFEAAQMSIIPQEINPIDLLDEAVATIRSMVEMQGLALKTRIAPDLPLIWADPTRIRQVLFNLLNNAVRFTEKGTITISAYKEDDELIFAVADTGIGIKPEDMDRLFQDFQQLDGSTRRKYSGTGLGLAISRRFVELHNGRIWVESKVGKGSTFFFSVPVTNHEALPSNVHSWTMLERDDGAADQPDNKRILLAVTRNFTVTNLLNRFLRKHRIVVVNTLGEAQFIVKKILPQSIFLDTSIENNAAVDSFLNEVSQAGLTNIPIVSCQFPVQETEYNLTVEGYLVKPVTPQQIWDVLRNFGENIDSVLVIDDDQDFIPLLNRILDNPIRRYRVVNAHTAQEGLSLLRRYKPDVVFVDLQLPDMNGLELIKFIRSNAQWSHIRIVIISGQDTLSKSDFIQHPIAITKVNGMTFNSLIQIIQYLGEIG